MIGQLASDSSSEFKDFAVDLVFEAYAKALQEAGYEIPEYSAECDHGKHRDCSGKSRLTDVPTRLERCWCLCHTNLAS